MLPAVFRRMGVLRLSGSLAEAVDAGGVAGGVGWWEERSGGRAQDCSCSSLAFAWPALAGVPLWLTVGFWLPAEAAGEDLQGDEREAALRAATVAAGAAICQAAAAGDGEAASGTGGSGSIRPWMLSMHLLQREEREQCAGRGKGQGPAGEAAPDRRHVAKGTLAY